MKVSYNWLKEFIDIPWDARELAERLEMTGTGVESITDIDPGFTKVVTGIVKAIEPHPQADKLSVTKVDAGTGEELTIVCGAKNIAVGDKVPVALIGAELKGGHKIGKATLRGVESFGMLCSETELELGEDGRGIMILDPETKIGLPLHDVLGLKDTVIEFEITPNRPDCMSMIGIAREVAALTGGDLRLPATDIVESKKPASGVASVRIDSPDLCPRYSARVVEGVKVGPSPFYMRSRLSKAGIRPINNLVDITNYVLLETGQPLHAFDVSLLRDGAIIIREAKSGEPMTTLDGVKRSLLPSMLVISDPSGPVALAGVMGGANSEINDSTVDCLIESAHFDPTTIFRTSFALDLRSEASARFERGTDIGGTVFAADRAAYLMNSLAGGTTLSGVIDEYPGRREPKRVLLNPERAKRIIGADIPFAEVKAILESLDVPVTVEAQGVLQATIPTFRPDLTREIDLIEEVARVYGFNRIPATVPHSKASALPLTAEQIVIRDAADVLVASGMYECINYSFIDPADITKLLLNGGDGRSDFLVLKNPLSENQSIMRTTLLPGLLKNVRFNAGYGISNAQLFETGRVFLDTGGDLPDERNMIAGVCAGGWEDSAWYGNKRSIDFFDVKGILETLAAKAGIGNISFGESGDTLLHPGQRAELMAGGRCAGSFGLLHPSVIKNFELENEIFVFELDASVLSEAAGEGFHVNIPSRFPAMTRDISLLAPHAIPVGEIFAVMAKVGGSILADISLFDLYAGEHVPAGQKSLAFRLTYRADDRTLTVEETDADHAKVLKALIKDLELEIR